MAGRRFNVRRGSRAALLVPLGVVTFLVVVGAASHGFAGVLIFLGLSLLLLGCGAVVVGRARWAFVHGRGVGALTSVAGLVLLIAGTTTVATPDEAVPAASAASASSSADRKPGASAPATSREPSISSPSPTPSAVVTPPATPAPVMTPTRTPTPTTTSTPTPTDVDELAGAAPAGTALALLDDLAVKGRAPKTGYDRDLFGSGWGDTDRNGCDTRNDILARDLVDVTYRPGTRDCVVLTGTLDDPFSGASIAFQRSEGTSTLVQIDHVVALSDAWQKGAQQWEPRKRLAFGNDPLNLLAVDGPLNGQKSDGDTATWLPPDRSFRCAYVARQVGVKAKYEVWVTAAEREAMARVLVSCPDEQAPVSSAPTIAPVEGNFGGTAPSAPPSTTAAQPTPTTAPPSMVDYENCDAVRAAGEAPLLRGEPGYGSHLDRNGDGIACEVSGSASEPEPAPEPAPEPSPSSSTDPRFDFCKDAVAAGYGPYVRGQDPEYDWYRDGDGDGEVCE